MFKPLVSIIVVDYKKNNPYLIECLDAIQKQTYKNHEVILVSDYKVNLSYPKLRTKFYGHYVGPAEKRDEGAKMAKGEILAFIDDDAYPDPIWLEKIVPHFQKKNIAGVGGPGITPIGVGYLEQASGWASASPMGAGVYTYRFIPGKRKFVDDYPSMNLAIRESDFDMVGGYDSNFWPGEDTKLCLDLTHKLNKKIIYEPKAVVSHHRRPVWKGHLKQNGNFGLHRGYFARILPATSFKPIYFLPSFLLLGITTLLVLALIKSYLVIPNLIGDLCKSIQLFGSILLGIYIATLLFNSVWIFTKSKCFLQAAISIPVIFATHLWYGARFLQGFLFTNKLTR